MQDGGRNIMFFKPKPKHKLVVSHYENDISFHYLYNEIEQYTEDYFSMKPERQFYIYEKYCLYNISGVVKVNPIFQSFVFIGVELFFNDETSLTDFIDRMENSVLIV